MDTSSIRAPVSLVSKPTILGHMAQLQKPNDSYAWYSNQFYYHHSPSPQHPYPSTVIHGSTLSSVHNPYYPSPPQSYTLSSAYNTLHQPPFNYSHFLPPAAGPPTPLSFLPSSQSVTYSSQQYQHQQPPYIHQHNSCELQRLSTWKNDDKNSEHQVFDKMPESNEIEKKVPVDTKEVLRVEDEKDGIEREHPVEKGYRGVDLGNVKGSVDKMESEDFVEDNKSDGSKKQGVIIKDLDVKCSVGLESHESKDVSIVIDVKAPITVKQEIPDKDDELVINFTVEEEAVPENAIDFSSENDCVSGASVERSLSPRLRDRNTITNSNRRGIKKDVVRKYRFRRKTNELEYELEGLFVNNGEMDVNYSALKPGLSLEHYNAILKRLESCSDSNAIEFFDWMRCKGKLEDSFGAYSLILRVLGRREEWDRAEDLIHQSFQVFNTVIYACAKKRECYAIEKLTSEKKLAQISSLKREVMDSGEKTKMLSSFCICSYLNSMVALLIEEILIRLGRSGSFNDMRKIVEDMKSSGCKMGTSLFLVLIESYAQFEMYDEILDVVHWMIDESGLKPDTHFYSRMLNLLVDGNNLKLVEITHTEMSVLGVKPDVSTFNVLIKALCKAHQLRPAILMMEDMPSYGLVPDEKTFTTIMQGFIEEGDLEGALRIREQMVEFGCSWSNEMTNQGEFFPDQYTFNTLVNGLCKAGHVKHAMEIMDVMLQEGYDPDVYTYNSVISGLCKLGEVKEAVEILDQMITRNCSTNTVTYNTLISTLCKENQIEEAMELARVFTSKGILPDVCTLNSLIQGLCLTRNHRVVMELFDELRGKGSEPDEFTYNMLIDSLCSKGKLNEALDMLKQMESSGCARSVITYNTLIDGFCKANKIREAEEIFDEMEVHGVSRNSVTYNTLIDGLCKSRRVDDASQLMDQMIMEGQKPDKFTYNSLLTHFCRGGDIKKAADIVQAMTSNRCEPDIVTYGTLISGLCKAGRVEVASKLLRSIQMKGIALTPHAYNRVIQGLFRKKKTTEAINLFREMIEQNETAPDVVSYKIVFRGLCNGGGAIREAVDFLVELLEKGFVPEFSSLYMLAEGLLTLSMEETLIKLMNMVLTSKIK